MQKLVEFVKFYKNVINVQHTLINHPKKTHDSSARAFWLSATLWHAQCLPTHPVGGQPPARHPKPEP